VLDLIETVVELVVLMTEVVVEVALLVDFEVGVDVEVATPERISTNGQKLGRFLTWDTLVIVRII